MNKIIASKGMLKKYLSNMNQSKEIVENTYKEIKKTFDEYNKLIESKEFQANFKVAVSPRLETIKESRDKLFKIFSRKPLIIKKDIIVDNEEIKLYIFDCFKNEIKNKNEIEIDVKFYAQENHEKRKKNSFSGVQITVIRYSDGSSHIHCTPVVSDLNNISNINKYIEELEIMMESGKAELDPSWLVSMNAIYNSAILLKK